MSTRILLVLTLLVAGHAYAAVYQEPDASKSFTPVSKATPLPPVESYASNQSNRPVIDIGQVLDDTATDNLGNPIHFPVGDHELPNTGCGCKAPPPVPVPASVWLLGSGLLGLTCVSRRLKNHAAQQRGALPKV